MFDYFLDRVPTAAKPLTFVFGMRGHRQKGLLELERTAAKGRTAHAEAQSVLAAIYSSESEKQWDKAGTLYTRLLAKYPHNPRYRLGLVYVCEREGLWDSANHATNAEGPWINTLDPSIRSRVQVVALYRTVENLLFTGRYAQAAPLLARLDSGPRIRRLVDWIAIRQGNYWDATGERAKAKEYYLRVQHKKTSALAQAFMQTAFPSGPKDVMPNRWPVASQPE